MRLFRKRVRLDDPDDMRKHYSGIKKIFIVLGAALLILILFLVYLFLPVWTYVLLIPLFTVAFVWRPKEPDEDTRIRKYLERIPAGERFSKERFYSRMSLPEGQLQAAAQRFPDWCGGDKEILEADEMYYTVLCWYFGTIKQLGDDAVVRRLQSIRSES